MNEWMHRFLNIFDANLRILPQEGESTYSGSILVFFSSTTAGAAAVWAGTAAETTAAATGATAIVWRGETNATGFWIGRSWIGNWEPFKNPHEERKMIRKYHNASIVEPTVTSSSSNWIWVIKLYSYVLIVPIPPLTFCTVWANTQAGLLHAASNLHFGWVYIQREPKEQRGKLLKRDRIIRVRTSPRQGPPED